jgi:hypothetical protein
MPKSTEVQRNYLKVTDPLVKLAIQQPISFNNQDQLSEIQKEAVESGKQDVLIIIGKIQNSIIHLNSEENNLCLDVAATLVESQGKDFPPAWQIFFKNNPERAEELYPIIEKLRDLISQLVKKNIDIHEYVALINNIYQNNDE